MMVAYSYNKEDKSGFSLFDQWLGTELGQVFLDYEHRAIKELLEMQYGVFGGVCTGKRGKILVDSMNTHYRYLLTTCEIPDYSSDKQIVFHPLDWPIMNGAFDLVILHHSLELTKNPHALLREAARTVSHNGKLVIIGIHPMSLYCLMKCVMPESPNFLNTHQVVSMKRLIDWLTLLGYRVENVWHGGHDLPFNGNYGVLMRNFIRMIGLPNTPLGAFYIIQTVADMSLIPPVSSRWASLKSGLNQSAPIARDGCVVDNCSGGDRE